MSKFIVCLIAGAGAGFGTGLAGLSAAAVIAPMLITFLHVNAYEAVGIALASDVLASAVSAYTYKKNNNIDVKNGMFMLISVLIFTALTGAASHFAIGGGITDLAILVMCIIFTLIGAMLTAKFANKASAKVLNRTLGFGLAAMSIAMIIINYV